MTARKYVVVVQEWEESERGWGCRPDGASLHLTEADRVGYCKRYWDEEKARNGTGGVPSEYTRECGAPTLLDVDAKTHARIQKAGLGLRLWPHDYYALLRKS